MTNNLDCVLLFSYICNMVQHIILKNDISETSRLEFFLQEVCRGYELSDKSFRSLNLAVEEWAVNVINHAYPEGTKPEGMEITAEVMDGVLKLVVKDHGIAFDPTKHHEADVEATLEYRQVGGLGIHMIRSIMDTMSYERTADGYNVLTLTKKIGQ